MAISKNFVVKNGLEVAIDSLVVDTDTRRVGIASTIPSTNLDVRGGIGATHLEVTGIATIATLSVTGFTATNGDFTNLTGTSGTITSLESTNGSITNLSGTIGTFSSTLNSYLVIATELSNTNGTITNLSGTISTITNMSGTIGTITNLVGTSGTITNIIGTSGTITNLVGTSGTITNITGTSGTITNLTFTEGSGTNLNVTGITTLATADIASLTITGAAVTNLSVTNNFDVAGLSTFTGAVDANGDLDVDGHTELDDVNVSGTATITSLDVQSNFDVYDSQATFHNDVLISGNLSIGGTLATVFVEDLRVSDKDLILGFTTDTSNNDVSDDDTANHGGIAIASTEGNPLVPFTLTGINTLPDTYKQIMWVKADSYGFGTTDAWLFNYGVGIGSTLVPNGVRLAVSEIQFTDDTIDTPNATITEDASVGRNFSVTGLSTFTGIGTFQSDLYVGGNLNVTGDLVYDEVTGRNLNITGIATIGTTLDVDGDIDVDGHTELDDLNVSGIATIATVDINAGDIEVSNVDTTDLNVTGVSTFGTVQISSGIITSTTGDVVYYGDGSYLTGNARNLTATIGIGTSGGVVGYGVSFLDLRGAGVSTAYYNGDVGIATIFFEGGGGGGSASIGIGSTPGDAFVGVVTAGNLWYNTDIGRLFIYYQDVDSAQWVDAAPFNVGVITSLSNVSFVPGSAVSPSMYFIGDTQTGFFSPTPGQFTIVSSGSSILNINPSGINVTGIATAQDFDALSDINFKENVTTVNNALLKVEQLRGVKFDWKESGKPSYGVIAQELEQILPELVHGNDPKTVNYNGIIGVLIEAIKELKAEVEELKNTK